jgi:hypothetical protein
VLERSSTTGWKRTNCDTFVSLELLVEPSDPGVRPELLEVSTCRHDQFDAIEAQLTDDIQDRLGVRGGAQIVKTPTQTANLGLALRA